MSALLVSAASWTMPFAAHHRRVRHRSSPVTCGAVATFCKHRFGISEDIAQRTEAKLKHRAEYIDATMSARICDALQSRLGLSEAQLQKLVVKVPSVLSFSFESNIEPSLAKLQSRLGLSEAQLQKVVVALPAVLSYSFESNIESKLDFLQGELGLSLDAMRAKVLTCPAVLGYSLAQRYRPRLEVCSEVGADPILVVNRVRMTDERFYASIGWAGGL